MILFFNKKTGYILGTIGGRVHDQAQLKMSIVNKETTAEDVGKFIIGFEQLDETEDYEVEVEAMEEVSEGLFKKVKATEIRQRNKLIKHNMDKFEILQRFEDDTPENALDYKIINNNLIKK
jgi:hypothetical protein